MFWVKPKKENSAEENEILAEIIALEAEGHFRSGKMHCAEAVLVTIRNHFSPETPDDVLRLAAGFGGGSGVGCICGAVAGGTMALGLVLKDDNKAAKRLTKELHHWFKSQYGATCCKVITTEGKKGCPLLTGMVAGKVAELIES